MGGVRRDLSAGSALFSHRVVLFSLQAGLTQEARLLTELRCGCSLRLRGAFPEGAGALPREPSLGEWTLEKGQALRCSFSCLHGSAPDC